MTMLGYVYTLCLSGPLWALSDWVPGPESPHVRAPNLLPLRFSHLSCRRSSHRATNRSAQCFSSEFGSRTILTTPRALRDRSTKNIRLEIAARKNWVHMTVAHPGLTVWFTGLSGSGKSTLSLAVSDQLAASGYRVQLLDGDEVRLFLSKGLGFSKEDRDENIRRIGYVAELLTRNGVITLVSAISPYRSARDAVRIRIPNFLEVFVNAPIEECERRDVKGLYKRARAGEIKTFTGISDPYEQPLHPELECRTDLESVPESVQRVIDAILSQIMPK